MSSYNFSRSRSRAGSVRWGWVNSAMSSTRRGAEDRLGGHGITHIATRSCPDRRIGRRFGARGAISNPTVWWAGTRRPPATRSRVGSAAAGVDLGVAAGHEMVDGVRHADHLPGTSTGTPRRVGGGELGRHLPRRPRPAARPWRRRSRRPGGSWRRARRGTGPLGRGRTGAAWCWAARAANAPTSWSTLVAGVADGHHARPRPVAALGAMAKRSRSSRSACSPAEPQPGHVDDQLESGRNGPPPGRGDRVRAGRSGSIRRGGASPASSTARPREALLVVGHPAPAGVDARRAAAAAGWWSGSSARRRPRAGVDPRRPGVAGPSSG